MGNFVFNVAKGSVAYYASLPASNDALIVVPLEQDNLEDDNILIDMDNLGQILSGSTNEQTTMGRKTAVNVTVTVNDTDNCKNLDMDNIVWTAANGNPVRALLICYDPDTTASSDSSIIPLAKYDFNVTPSTGDVTLVVPTVGFMRAM